MADSTPSGDPMDLLFYALAIWQGYQCSIRSITSEEIHDRLAAEGMHRTHR